MRTKLYRKGRKSNEDEKFVLAKDKIKKNESCWYWPKPNFLYTTTVEDELQKVLASITCDKQAQRRQNVSVNQEWQAKIRPSVSIDYYNSKKKDEATYNENCPFTTLTNHVWDRKRANQAKPSRWRDNRTCPRIQTSKRTKRRRITNKVWDSCEKSEAKQMRR